MTENEIVEGCRKGDRKAQYELYNMYASQMNVVAKRYFYDEDDRKEVLQLAFIKVFKSIDSFKGTGRIGGWIRRIVVNKCLNTIRSNKKYDHTTIDEVYDDLTQEDVYEGEYSYDSLMKALDILDDKKRMIFNLYCFEGYNHYEIGEKLNIKATNSRMLLSRARGQLQQHLKTISKKQEI